MLNDITDIAGLTLREHMDVSWLNQQAIANNLANANTPGYKGTHVTFQKTPQFQPFLELAQTQTAHLSALPSTTPVNARVENSGPVNLDSELADMSKNSLFYQTLSDVVQRRDHMAQTAIEGR